MSLHDTFSLYPPHSSSHATMSLPFLYTPPLSLSSRTQSIPTFLEFLQHHLLLGVAHIFVTMPFTWDGAIHTYMRLLRSFIEEGSLSLNTHIHHDKDYLYALFGLEFERDNMKTLQVRRTVCIACSYDDYDGHCCLSEQCHCSRNDVGISATQRLNK